MKRTHRFTTALNYIFIFCLILAINPARSQNAAKGFSKLEKKEYVKASEYFQEALLANDLDILGNYGMALLYANNTFQRFDLFHAFRSVRLAKTGIQGMNDGQLADFNKVIPDFKGAVSRDYERIERELYESIKQTPTLENSEKFVLEFSNSQYYHEVTQIKSSLEFQKALAIDSVSTYNLFIEKFPGADQIGDAIKARDKAAYKIFAAGPTLAAAYDYIARYPASEQLNRVFQTRDSLEFVKAATAGTAEGFEQFIYHFPNAAQVNKAINLYVQKFYEKAQTGNTVKDYQDFINRFAGTEQGEGAVILRDNLQFKSLKETNSTEAYNRFISWYPNSNRKKEAINLRDLKAFDDAVQTNSIAGFEAFLNNYPTSIQFPKALQARNSLLILQGQKIISLTILYEFLSKYPTLLNNEKMTEARDLIAFKDAEAENTREAYEAFILNYPASKLLNQAKEKLKTAKQ